MRAEAQAHADSIHAATALLRRFLDWDRALKRLEEIVRRLESGDASLDESILLYGEGDRLRQQCEARLQAALDFRASNNLNCPAAVSAAPSGSSSKPTLESGGEGWMFKSPARENRILEKPRTGIAF